MTELRGIHRCSGGVVNFYLVEDGGKVVLVDAGTPGDWGLLARQLGELGRSPDDVEAVLLTHAHADHVGFGERARTEAGATVWVHAEDEAVAKGAKPPKNDGSLTRYLLRAEFYRTVFSLVRRGGAKIVPIVELSTFEDGEVLDIPGRPRVVHVPGHTPGTTAIWLEERQTLLTGDALVTRNPLTGRVGPQIMPSGFNRDTERAMRSLDALKELPARVILPGHGEPWVRGTAEAVKAAREAGPS